MNRTLWAACCLILAACSGESADTTAPAATAEKKAAAEPVAMPRSASPDDARVFFITPADGDTVTSPLTLEFGIEGMSVVPAGTDEPASGHHHLIINAGLPPLGQPIPANDNYRHFGDGSTTTTIELEPGSHTLQLLLGDHLHVPHDPPVASEQITVIVE